MNVLNKFLNKLISKYVEKHRDALLKKKQVREYLDGRDEYYTRRSASIAFKNILASTSLSSKYTSKLHSYSNIPKIWLVSLRQETFPSDNLGKITKSQKEDIQFIFTFGYSLYINKESNDVEGYLQEVEAGFQYIAREYLKTRLAKIAILVAVVIVILVITGTIYLKHEASVKYWAAIDTSQVYKGDGFTETFPCSGVRSIKMAGSSDLTSDESMCTYSPGPGHNSSDMYIVNVEHFLTDKYSPASEVTCGDPMIYTGSANTQVYYSEKRQEYGLTWVLCGKGQNPIMAKMQSGNTVYTLEAIPNKMVDTSADLDTLLRSFQLN